MPRSTSKHTDAYITGKKCSIKKFFFVKLYLNCRARSNNTHYDGRLEW